MAKAVRQRSPQSPLDLEGFLCPICLKDLGDSSSLAAHFDNAHNTGDTGDSPDVLDQVKGFFGKAKKFFAFEDDEVVKSAGELSIEPAQISSTATTRASSGTVYYEPQEIGKTRMLTDSFKSLRDAKIDQTVIECNKLVIRLSKLTGEDVPEDRLKRKAFEQSIVSWAGDSSTKSCTTCAKNFNIARRRHHCRLCGEIMCDKCSEFLPFTQARLLSTSVTNTELTVTQPVFLKRRGSNSSLNSLGSMEEGPTLRTCSKCRKLLELHRSKQEQRHLVPAMAVLYEKLQTYRVESVKLTPEYVKMAFSLRSGETTHSLEKATSLRQQIARLYNNLETVSKKIVNLKDDDGVEPSQATVKLRLHIRAYTISYIQECSATLPSLPDQDEYAELVNQKEEQRKRKVQMQLKNSQEKARSQEVPLRKKVPQSASSHVVGTKPTENKAVVAAGWKPGEVDTRQVMDDDPMVQQMNIIKGYLRQAKQAQRHDEVEMLEENLRHLEEQFYQQ